MTDDLLSPSRLAALAKKADAAYSASARPWITASDAERAALVYYRLAVTENPAQVRALVQAVQELAELRAQVNALRGFVENMAKHERADGETEFCERVLEQLDLLRQPATGEPT